MVQHQYEARSRSDLRSRRVLSRFPNLSRNARYQAPVACISRLIHTVCANRMTERPSKRQRGGPVPPPAGQGDILGPTTGVLHDPCYQQHKHPSRRHPERPERIEAVVRHLETVGLLERCMTLAAVDVDYHELHPVHNKHYLHRLKRLEAAPLERLVEEAEQFDSVYLNQDTVACARKAAGGLMGLVREVAEGRLKNGVAIIRPPGHHAEAHHAKGFCIINNVAVAAQYARSQLGVSRVLVVDWDVHHGNGTQRIFLDDPSVLYFSVHRYDHGRFWPGGADGSHKVVGTGAGEGYTVNVGWNGAGAGDPEYLEVWRSLLMPIARAYQPELVLVSAGFDGVDGDDIGGGRITPGGYAAMTRKLMELAGGKVVLALEGGYKLSVLPHCIQACLEALMGHLPASLDGLKDEEEGEAEEEQEEEADGDLSRILPDALASIRSTIEVHGKYWPCLKVH